LTFIFTSKKHLWKEVIIHLFAACCSLTKIHAQGPVGQALRCF
jgi:hypothetical protein